MSIHITEAFVQQYSSNFYHLAQQKGSRLKAAVRVEKQKGKSAFYDRIGLVEAQARTTRHGDTPQLDTPHSRRMVTLADYEWADLIDQQDKIRMLADPASEYVMAAANAFGRKMDDVVIAAALGSAATGETGSGSQALPAAQKLVPVSGGAHVNLNVQALRYAKLILDAADVDPSLPRYCAINASGLFSLLGETAVTSSDYANVKALVQGEVDTFLGFKFLRTERLTAIGSNLTTVSLTDGTVGGGASTITAGAGMKSMICWAGDGLLLSVGEDYTGRIDERSDKSYSTQVYARMSIGAVRMEESKIVQIVCKQ
jgi:hypothetical protein